MLYKFTDCSLYIIVHEIQVSNYFLITFSYLNCILETDIIDCPLAWFQIANDLVAIELQASSAVQIEAK